ncbi:hypothetical protein [Kribbella sp. NPDC049227]|uniref:hypothetical protein n=1 Tax=Kribbella sp. NPDC049227 TaxID=3364113 RepID=UPI003713A517
MRTEEDLRDALEHLADQAAHPGDVRAHLQSRDTRRSRGAVVIIGTAIATAIAAVAAAVVPHVISGGESSPATQDNRNTAWSPWVDLNLPKHIQAVGQRLTANSQDYELNETVQLTWTEYCQLQLHRNGDFDPSTIPADSPEINLGRQKARVVTSTKTKPFLQVPPRFRDRLIATTQKTLAWQPMDGVWALLSCESQRKLGTKQLPKIDGPVDPNLKLAVSLATPFSPPTRSLRSPVKLGELPKGVAPRELEYRPLEKGLPGSGENFRILLSDGNPATGYVLPVLKPSKFPKSRAWDAGPGDDLSITYDTSKGWNQMTSISAEPAAIIHGMNAYFTQGKTTKSKTDSSMASLPGPMNTLRLESQGVAVVITSYATKPSKESLRRIAETMQLAKNPKDPGTWFDAATAIP